MTSQPSAQQPDVLWFQRPSGGAGALPPRARLHTDDPVLDLNGTWAFRSFATVADAVRFCDWPAPGPATDQSVTVPAHWVLDRLGDPRVHGRPAYTNVKYPFPVGPPFVPDANPSAWYHRSFEWADTGLSSSPRQFHAEGGRAVLRFDGVESAYRVWVNGQWVGQAMGSRLMHEFDVTACLRPDTNHVAVLVHQFSAGSYLEDQDQWWLPGIFRDVSLLLEAPGQVLDAHVVGDWDPSEQRASLHVEISAPEDSFPVRIEVDGADGRRLAHAEAAGTEAVELAVAGTGPWSPESPSLVEVRLITVTGATVYLSTGFRRIEVDGHGVLRANGDPLRFRGVNRHETRPLTGRAVSEQETRTDYQIMVDHHVNAVRTAHYPPAPHALDLADSMGLWVMLEGDVETHGFDECPEVSPPAQDPQWAQAVMERTQRMWHRDKNHVCVAMVSLANESSTGPVLRAAAQWLTEHTPALVHYEGDRTASYTHVHSRMYATPAEWRQLARGQAHPTWTAEEAARVSAQPLVLCEYAHAMGNGPGGLEDYERVFREYPRACGGFVWEFKDHGIRRPDTGQNGREQLAYGGDFGEPVHDGSFVMDGLCSTDAIPSPGMAEFAAVVDPLHLDLLTEDFQCAGPGGRARALRVGNGYDHSLLTRLCICVEGLDGARMSLHEVQDLRPGESVELALPELAGMDGAVVSVTTVVSTDGRATRRHRELVVAPGMPEPREPAAAAPVDEWPDEIRGASLSVWRAPTDNDEGATEPTRALFGRDPSVDWCAWSGVDPRDATPHGAADTVISTSARWQHMGLDVLSGRCLTDTFTAPPPRHLERTWAPASAGPGAWHGRQRTTWHPDGEGSGVLCVDLDLDPAPSLARAGIELLLDVDPAGEVSWRGGGPHEAAPDARAASRYGRWSAPATDLYTRYPRPQSTGTRHDLREVSIPLRDGRTWRLEVLSVDVDGHARDEGLWWSLLPWSDRTLVRHTHDHQLPAEDTGSWTLHLDAAHHGLGSRSCGVAPPEEHRCRVRTARIVARIHPSAQAKS